MGRKTAFALVLTMLFVSMFMQMFELDIQMVEAQPTTWIVDDDEPADFPEIQQAITAASPGDIIYVKSGVYFEHLVVNKTVSIIGENRATTVIDANGTGKSVFVSAHNVVIKEFTIKGGNETAVYLYNSDNTKIMQNTIIENEHAVWALYSDNTTVDANVIANNTGRGILITLSWDFTVSNNEVYGNGWYGIHYNASYNGLIAKNQVHKNVFAGIGLHDGARNIRVVGNNVTNNDALGARGVWVENSTDNLIYDNNFINNNIAYGLLNSTSKWDNDIEGNYWSDYVGVDNNQDGIGDTPHILDVSNRDNYPLMGRYSEFSTSLGYSVKVISNSSIGNFEFSSNISIQMYVSNVSTTQSFGFSRMGISKGVMTPPYNITIDNGLVDVIYFNDTILDSRIQRTMYFSYPLSTRKVLIQGSPGLDLAPPVIAIVSPENKTYAINSVPLTFTVDEPTSFMGYSLDSQANVTVVGNFTIFGLSDGAHVVMVYANDTNGNMGKSNTVHFTVDTKFPKIEIILPANKTYETNSVPLNLTIDEPVVWIGYNLNGQTNITVVGNTTIFGLSDGTYMITVYANDTSGNMGFSNTVHFSVDATSPNIEIFSPENKTYETNSVVLNLTIDEPVVWIGYSLDGQTNVTIAGNATLHELTNGLHSLVVYATDVVGHTGASQTISFTVGSSGIWPELSQLGIALAIMAAAGAGLVLIIYLVKFRKSGKTDEYTKTPVDSSTGTQLSSIGQHVS